MLSPWPRLAGLLARWSVSVHLFRPRSSQGASRALPGSSRRHSRRPQGRPRGAPGHPKGAPGHPKEGKLALLFLLQVPGETHLFASGVPVGAPRCSQERALDAHGSPRVRPGTPQGCPRGAQGCPMDSPEDPKTSRVYVPQQFLFALLAPIVRKRRPRGHRDPKTIPK